MENVMNDFTKEELKDILETFHSYFEATDNAPYDYEQELIDKIQDMIDNYCEHDFEYKDIGKAKLCIKCFSLLPIGKGCIEASTEPA
jgi:hypothetical protein